MMCTLFSLQPKHVYIFKGIKQLLPLLVLLPSISFGQIKQGKPIEFSPFYSIAVSHSYLSNNSNKNVKSPPTVNGFNYGIKAERLISKDSIGVFVNAAIFGLDLSVGTHTDIHSGGLTGFSSIWAIPHYLTYSLGIKKVLHNSSSKHFKFNFETGLRMLRSIKGAQNIEKKDIIGFDTVNYKREYTFVFERRTTLVPYIGIGTDFTYKKIKIGLQFWAQRSFQTIYQYNLHLQNKNTNYDTKVGTNGLSWGAFVYVRVLKI